MDLGAKIRQAREGAGLTQASLAFAMRAYPLMEKVGPSRISDWEANKYPRIPFLAVVAIAQVTGQPIGFFSGELAEPPATDDAGQARRGDQSGAVADAAEKASRRPRGRAGQSPRRSKGSPS